MYVVGDRRGRSRYNLLRLKEPERLHPDQEAVAFATVARLAVLAGAGSGKTRVLVERYIWHIQDGGHRPEGMLTITFTRKAAGEMKQRIVDRLRGAKLEEHARSAETGPIQTIHSFCERVLRENAAFAGIDPKFEVMGEGPAHHAALQSAFERAMEHLREASTEARAVVFDLAPQRHFWAPTVPMGALTHQVKSLLETLRGSGHRIEDLEPVFASTDAYTQAVAAVLAAELNLGELPGVKGNLAEWLGEVALALRSQVKKPPKWLNLRDLAAEEPSAARAVGVGQLVLAVWREYEAQMTESQVFDFAELERLTVRLLAEQPSVVERLRRQYRVVLVDEAQDVNPTQHRLLDTLGIEHEMIVGDPQQSIYAFRHADRQLFIDRVARTEQRNLPKNWRTDRGILCFIDHLFGSIWGKDYRPMATNEGVSSDDPFGTTVTFDGVEFWEHGAKFDAQLTAQRIQELLSEGMEPKETAVLVRKSARAADIEEALRVLGIDTRIVGGAERFYTRMEIRDLANAMHAATDPWNDYALLALLRSPIVGLSLDSIVLLARERPVWESLPKFLEAGPPIGEDAALLRDFLAWFEPLTYDADRLAAWEVLSEILSRTRFFEVLAERRFGRQSIANVRKLLEIASKEPGVDAGTFAERIREIQLVRHTEGDAPAVDEEAQVVTLMTIHKAKGLEFPCVVLPDLFDPPRQVKDSMLADPKSGLIATSPNGGKPVFYRLLCRRKEEAENEEENRLLYVAMTRAKHRLCLCLSDEARQGSAAALLARRYKYRRNPLPGVRVRALPGSD